MINKISLILTYYNEEKNILSTLKSIFDQTLLPNELILINSGSTDKSKKIIDNFLKKQKKKIKTFNFSLDTDLPSTSKNMGIQVSNNQLVAFMDFGISFSKEWLKNQFDIMNKKKVDAVIGTVKLSGNGLFDKASVINTYGNKNSTPCIPGSLIKKKTFYKLGFFEKSRSLYDVLWKERFFKSKFKFYINNEAPIRYEGVNYSDNIKNLFQKSYLYTSDKINLIKNPRTIFYLTVPFIIILLFFIQFNYIYYLLLAYIVLRFINIAFKSNFNSLINFKLIFLLLITSFVIDLGRFFGAVKAFLIKIGINNIITLFLLIYFICFNTPIISMMASNLIASQNIISDKKYDAIVVFSGDGKTSYTNDTYRKRALDAIQYAKKHNVKKIFLSSGRDHTISEVEIIKLFLKEQNFDKNVFIFEKFPSSTYNNIIMVGDQLTREKFKNIIFITAPYHYKRSILIWNKNFPNLTIFPAKNVSFSLKKYKWIQNFDEIKITIYEYLAIFHNRLWGYL